LRAAELPLYECHEEKDLFPQCKSAPKEQICNYRKISTSKLSDMKKRGENVNRRTLRRA
jgi:hypothetical protein